jgi:tRNA(Ile)-lysidine synthase
MTGRAELARAGDDLHTDFAAVMAWLGPFEPHPRLAAGVSGGADSTALALLADAWVRRRGGSLLALVVDHGLRAESAAEAALTAERLAMRGIAVRCLHAVGLARGPAIAERARIARYQLLADACAADGILHLLIGHHAADQAETVMIRALGNSGDLGLAAMPALAESGSLRLLRPLLDVPPERLRRFLTRAGMPWVEDPSNQNPHGLRARLRALRGETGLSAGMLDLSVAAKAAGKQRALCERTIAADLANAVSIRAEGYAVLPLGPIPCGMLAALIQTIGGAPYSAPSERVAALAAQSCPVTIAGVRLLPAGRMGPGWLVVREAAAMDAPVPAVPGATWDRRFRLAADAMPPNGAMIGALGDDAADLRHRSDLPAAVLRTLPAMRLGKILVAVPHLLYPDAIASAQVRLVPNPPRPVAGAPFCPASPRH